MRKFYRIEYKGQPRYAFEEGGAWRLLDGDLFGSYRAGDGIAAPDRLLAPVLPSKMVCIGLNYKDHAAEQNKPLPTSPLMFIKPSTSAIGPGESIVIPSGIGRVDHEAEVDYRAPGGVGVQGLVNGEKRQDSSTAQLVFSIDYLVAYITRVMTLLPGDIIATGTPSGIGPLRPGDRVTINVAGVGELTNAVTGEQP